MRDLQQQSPLFRIPRELRDEIYAYYAYDEEGLAYDYPTKRLKYASSRDFDLDLSFTCRIAADELKRFILQINTITFTSALSQNDSNGYRGLTSRAGRFEALLFQAQWTKIVMLHYAASCVSDNILEQVIHRFPSVDPAFRSAFRAIRRGHDIKLMSNSPHKYRDIFSASFCDAVHLTLQLTSSNPDFENLIAKACDSAQYHYGQQPLFIRGSHRKIMDWQPCLWSIPTDSELSSMESLLISPPGPQTSDCAQRYHSIAWYFSATTVLIHFLRRLEPDVRKHLRSVVLREDCKSVGNPAVHAEGLVPFCMENPRLRILTRAGLSSNVIPSIWALPCFQQSASRGFAKASGIKYYCVIIDWLIRMASLPTRGMPANSFKVLLEVQSEEAVQLWRQLEKIAAAREALPKSVQDLIATSRHRSEYLRNMFRSIENLPKALSLVVKNILAGTSCIKIDGVCRKPWTTADTSSGFQNWYDTDYGRFSNSAVPWIDVPGGVVVYRKKYILPNE
jgi:hypothetical protein